MILEFLPTRIQPREHLFVSNLRELLGAERLSAIDDAKRHATIVRNAADIPTKSFVVERHAASKTLMPPEVHKSWPHELARLTHPIHTKSATYISRPLQFRGGMLMELWKRKGSRSMIVSYRDDTLCCEDSEALGSFNRSSILPLLAAMATATTMGSGSNGGACDTAHLVVTDVLATALRVNVCGYGIFAAVSSASASLHRNISLMRDDDGDEIWMAHLVHCGYTPEQPASIIALACDLVTWGRARRHLTHLCHGTRST